MEVQPRAKSDDGRIEAILKIDGDYGDEWCVFRNFGTEEEGDWRIVEWRPYRKGDKAEDVLAAHLADPLSGIYG